MIKQIVAKILPSKIVASMREAKVKFTDGYSIKSYSQEGEDMILNRIFGDQIRGFYIDVGAHHPKRYSNTYYFYKRGWRGINLDAMPGSMDPFNKERPRDINVEKPISDKKEVLCYYIFNEPAYNGFSKEISLQRDGFKNYFIEATKVLETSTLEEILDKHLPYNQTIDFLSIDVEGLDFNVLKSNNFKKYRPKVILIEVLGSKLEDIMANEISQFLKEKGYSIYAKAVNTVFFMENNLIRD